MTKFEEMYGVNFIPNARQVKEEVLRVLKSFDRLIDCDEILNAVYGFFGESNLVQDAAIEGWIKFYSN